MQPDWLDATEQQAWIGLLSSTALLDSALDQQLRRDAGITHVTYAILAVLGDAPERTLHMQKLSVLISSSPSRLSHAISRLEQHGYVQRSPCPHDRKAVHATLTDAGVEVVRSAAPGHVATVRQLVFDRLTPAQVRQLTKITGLILEAIAQSGRPVPDLSRIE